MAFRPPSKRRGVCRAGGTPGEDGEEPSIFITKLNVAEGGKLSRSDKNK